MRPPPLPHQIEVLDRVLERIDAAVAHAGAPPLVVFGLDGTLFDIRPRTLQILMEYADEIRGDYPDVADAISSLDGLRIQYLLTDTLRECGISQAEVIRDVTTFWRERFLSDDYCPYDVACEGAPEYVRACQEAGAAVVYMSARDVPGMLLGTVASLRDQGLPIAEPGVSLVLKPDSTMGDEAFKRGNLPELRRYGQVVGVFDNDPAVCNLAREHFEHAEVVLVEFHQMPGPFDLLDGIELVTDFRAG